MLRTIGSRYRWALIFAVSLIIVVTLVSALAVSNSRTDQDQPSQQAEPSSLAPEPLECADSDQSLVKTLASGNAWRFCWGIDYQRGLTLRSVEFKLASERDFVPVLGEIGLSQLNVAYDDGSVEYDDATSYGFGGGSLRPYDQESCSGGDLLQYAPTGNDSLNAVCESEQSYGPGYMLHEAQNFTRTGTQLKLTTQSKINWYEYYIEYTLRDDGQIDARLGATGDLSPTGYTDSDSFGSPVGEGQTSRAVSHFHSAVWRIYPHIGGPGRQEIERSSGTVSNGNIASSRVPVREEGTFTRAPFDTYRVVNPSSLNSDMHARSYEIVQEAEHFDASQASTSFDIAFSENDQSEQFATGNVAATPGGTKDTVPEFVSDRQSLTDPVVWVNVGFHHIPRDEDQSPMLTHWQGFSLVPRDFFAQSPLIPDELRGVNGREGSPLSEFLPSGVLLNESGGYVSPPRIGAFPGRTVGDVAPYARVLARDFYRIEGVPTGDVPGNAIDDDEGTVWDGATVPPINALTLEWPRSVVLQSSQIVWAVRGPDGHIPQSYSLEYRDDGGAWHPLPFNGSVGEAEDGASEITETATFTPVSVRALRVTAEGTETSTVAIATWRAVATG